MAITIEQAHSFILRAKRARDNWLVMADRSWGEIKKRQKNNRLWTVSPNAIRKRAKYPAWYSIFKIRQPLVLSRVGIPIGKDTTQDGIDNIGAIAALCLERLAVNLARSFDFFDVMARCRDDFLATNFAQCRAYYERDTVKEEVKEYITPQKDEKTGDVVFIDAAGQTIVSDDIGQDDVGYFIETEQIVDIEDERICLEHILYKDVYVDPDIRSWNRCKRLAFAEYYSRDEFKQIFGAKALLTLPSDDTNPDYLRDNRPDPKSDLICVFEYWDEFEKDCKWFCDNGTDFISPKSYLAGEQSEDYGKLNGLYNLSKFFPTPSPLIMNQATDEFWPVPEYYQLVEILEDIHTIFSRMMACTRAIRSRVLFDANVEGLQQALNEAWEGDAFGVSNLAQALVRAGGRLDGVVQYIPVAEMIEGLQQLYQALEQRLNSVYKLTGTSDLLQGLVTDPTQRTFGERQMTEKYALNQLADPQRKMQEFVRASYQLLCEMALQNFTDASLDRYVVPQTLPPDHQARYRAAMGMLKNNQKRFRVELETDSTIAINENYDKQIRVELTNTLTGALEKAANIAQTNPALLGVELHCLKFLIQGFRQGKMFQQEITQAIDNVLKDQQAHANDPPPFDKEEARAALDKQALALEEQKAIAKVNADNAALQVEQLKVQSNERLEIARIQQDSFKLQLEQARIAQDDRLAAIQSQIDGFQIQNNSIDAAEKLKLGYAQLSSDIQIAQEKLQTDRDALAVEMRKITDKQEVEAFNAQMAAQVSQHELALADAQQQLEAYRVQLDEKEKYMTEARLQSEHELEKMRAQLEIVAQIAQARQAQMPVQPPIHVTVAAPTPVKTKKKIKVSRDQAGNAEYQVEDIQDPTGGA